jgi:hypothetical protein
MAQHHRTSSADKEFRIAEPSAKKAAGPEEWAREQVRRREEYEEAVQQRRSTEPIAEQLDEMLDELDR